MSAPMKMTSRELRDLSHGLDALTALRTQHGVDVDPYGSAQVQVGASVLRIGWDVGLEEYVVDDRNGD